MTESRAQPRQDNGPPAILPTSQLAGGPDARSTSQAAGRQSQQTHQPASQTTGQAGVLPDHQRAVGQYADRPANAPGCQPGNRPDSRAAGKMTGQPASRPARPINRPTSEGKEKGRGDGGLRKAEFGGGSLGVGGA